MRIDLNTRTPETPDNGKTEKAAARKPPASTEGSSLASDEARPSYDRVRVQHLEAAAEAAPEVRQDRIAALQSALGNGSYDVGASQIAEAIFDHMLAVSPVR